MQPKPFLQFLTLSLALWFQLAPASAADAVGLEVDLLEVHVGKGEDHLVFDTTLTVGKGADQALLKFAGGSQTRTSFDNVQIQAFYSRALSEKAALHLGVRHDVRAGPELTHGAAGIAGELLPGLDAEHYFYVSQHGDLTGAAQLVLGVDLAPRLVLEPRFNLGWSAQGIASENLGNGLTNIEASLRLRRELGENFNVYTGVVHERLLGSTRDIALAAGDPAQVTRAILGVGFSF